MVDKGDVRREILWYESMEINTLDVMQSKYVQIFSRVIKNNRVRSKNETYRVVV